MMEYSQKSAAQAQSSLENSEAVNGSDKMDRFCSDRARLAQDIDSGQDLDEIEAMLQDEMEQRGCEIDDPEERNFYEQLIMILNHRDGPTEVEKQPMEEHGGDDKSDAR